MRGRKLSREACSASTESAQAMSAAFASRRVGDVDLSLGRDRNPPRPDERAGTRARSPSGLEAPFAVEDRDP